VNVRVQTVLFWVLRDEAVFETVIVIFKAGNDIQAAFLKEMNPKIRVIAVEPDDALHGLEGLKHMATSITPGIYHEEELDQKIPVGTEDAYAMVYRLSQEEGVLVGQSSGAAMHVTLQVAKKLRAGTLVTVFPDFGDKYLTSNLWVGWRHQMSIGNQKFSI